MLDIHYIRENAEVVRDAIAKKQIALELDTLLGLDDERRTLITERDNLLSERNSMAPEQAKERGPAIKAQLSELEPKLAEVEAQFGRLMLLVPQIPAEDAPVGDETASVEVKQWGTPPQFDFAAKDHVQLAHDLDLVDFDRGTEVSGFRGYYLKNEAVLLHYGLMQLGLEIMRKRGFTLMVPPTKVKEFALEGSGHFPFGRGEIYQIGNAARMTDESTKEPAFLVGTAEPSLLAYHAHQTLDGATLPLKLAGISPCYRSEVGSHGKDAKGLYRIHEFMKVEQVIIAPADDEQQRALFAEMLGIVEELLQSLELPYRVIDTATADMGAGKVRMYDVETWMPSRNGYGETHSNSMLGDWQARRLGIKYKDQSGEKRYAYTLNNTVVASPRILIALLENHQQADGSVRVPEPLQRFVGADRIQRGA